MAREAEVEDMRQRLQDFNIRTNIRKRMDAKELHSIEAEILERDLYALGMIVREKFGTHVFEHLQEPFLYMLDILVELYDKEPHRNPLIGTKV